MAIDLGGGDDDARGCDCCDRAVLSFLPVLPIGFRI
jgi:hypothetical protein